MTEVKSTEASNCDTLVSELSMEPHSSLFQSETCPLFERRGAQKKVEVHLLQLSHKLISSYLLFRQKCFPADVLHFIHSQVQNFCYYLIGDVLVGLDGRSFSSESEKQCGFLKFRLLFLTQLLILHLQLSRRILFLLKNIINQTFSLYHI